MAENGTLEVITSGGLAILIVDRIISLVRPILEQRKNGRDNSRVTLAVVQNDVDHLGREMAKQFGALRADLAQFVSAADEVTKLNTAAIAEINKRCAVQMARLEERERRAG